LKYQVITQFDALKKVCEEALLYPVVMLDTEFVRIRTFHAQLGLIQLYDGESATLIDPIAIGDMSPLVALLQAPGVLKVLHACGEDLEVLHHVFGCIPTPFVDTQILAAFTGYGLSTGFAALVSDHLGVDLDKSESRTDWTARPLTLRQLEYAAADVFYLLPVYRQLRDKVDQLELWQAAMLESRLLAEKRTRPYHVDKAYLDIKGAWQLQPRQLAILKLLATWRYDEALNRNLALNFIIKEADLLLIARLALASADKMVDAGIDPRTVRRHGRKLCQLVREGCAVCQTDYPDPIVPISDFRGYKQLFKLLKDDVKQVSVQTHLMPEFLASRKQLNELISWVWKHQQDPDNIPELMQGWRKALLGDHLCAKIQAFCI
jgi:ribonuclease D